MLSLRHRLRSVKILASGGVIAYPTESVYGLGCDPFNVDAVERLLTFKQRSVKKGLILVAAGLDQIEPLLKGLTPIQRQRVQKDWPGPVTWLLPDPDDWIPGWIKGDFASVAVRVSAHPAVQDLCRAWGNPIVSSSANKAGQAPVRSEYSLRKKRLQGSLNADYIVPGRTQYRQNPTEIRDLQSGSIVRTG